MNSPSVFFMSPLYNISLFLDPYCMRVVCKQPLSCLTYPSSMGIQPFLRLQVLPPYLLGTPEQSKKGGQGHGGQGPGNVPVCVGREDFLSSDMMLITQGSN